MGRRDGAGSAIASVREYLHRRQSQVALRGAGAPHGPAGRAARSAAPAPREVTTGGKSRDNAIVDWLNVTFLHDAGADQVLEGLRALMGGLPIVSEPMGGGKHGFEHGVRLRAYVGAQLIPFGMFCWGGESQRGRALLSIEGGGCRVIQDWDSVAAWLQGFTEPRLTRVDLAVDLHEGDYTVNDCVGWVAEGLFNSGGRHPRTDCQGDWLNEEHGRTLYVGQAANGKMLRCYEKGKQLGDLASPWVRFEVQFGSRDRIIPFEILTSRDKYFAAAYPALAQVLAVVGEKIKTVRTTTRTTVEKALEHLKRSYGAWVDFITRQQVQSADLVEAVRVRAVPRRLNLASVADAGLAATVHAAIHERQGNNHEVYGD